MKLIKPSFEIIEQKPGMQGLYEIIELAARNCYKSEGLIKYDEEGNSITAKDFVDKVVNIYKHQSVAEHGTVYLHQYFEDGYRRVTGEAYQHYFNNPYSKVVFKDNNYYITTNYRVLLENNWLDDLKYMCEPTEYHEKRVTIRVKCSIGISREWNRHRSLSISEQSTRYCDFTKDKFNNHLTFVIPSWVTDIKPGKYLDNEHLEYLPPMWEHDEISQSRWFLSCKMADMDYYLIKDAGFKPQCARDILSLSTATEVVYTGFISDWKHFFSLRDNENAHPDMIALAKPLHEEFIKRGYINE